MLGAIVGDIIGSVYEFSSDKTTDFPLFSPGCHPTDDTLMTLAVGCACTASDPEDEYGFKKLLCSMMREIGRRYPDAGYGGEFFAWLQSDTARAYGSYGNGSAMRVSPVAYAAQSLSETERLAKWSAEVTHDHPEGIRGAQAVASAVYLARKGKDKEAIRSYITEKYYDLNFTPDEIRPAYTFDVTCAGSVPQALVCFLSAESFEDAVRLAVSLGGDGDTLAAMAGAVAGEYYGVPEHIEEQALRCMDDTLLAYYDECAELF